MTQSRKQSQKDSIQMREIKIRFVYIQSMNNNAEIKGEWVNGLTAYQNGFMVPNDNFYDVIRIEFEGEERPPRIRATVNG